MSTGDLYDRLRDMRKRLGPTEDKPEEPLVGDAKRRILLVDDDEDNLEVLSRRLAVHYEPVACRSGEEAVRRFTAGELHFCAVVMDIRMPGMPGLRAARLIREYDRFVPVIFRTGFSDEYPEDEVLTQYEGTVDYVTKGQRGQDLYLERAIRRGVKSYDALVQLDHLHDRLRRYEGRVKTLVEQLIVRERDLQTATDFQASLLGQTGLRQGISVAAAHRFCELMGGDFYDVIEVEPHVTGILIADICGHGIPAALITGMLKAQVAALGPVADPQKLMQEVNGRLEDLLSRRDRFVTAAYGVVDAATGEVVYASAGHDPIAVVDPAGAVRLYESTGPLIGASPSLAIENRSFRLARGETMWLYTDGVLDCRNSANEAYGRQRLMEQVARLKQEDLQQWADGVLLECEAFGAGLPIEDDMTILSARLT